MLSEILVTARTASTPSADIAWTNPDLSKTHNTPIYVATGEYTGAQGYTQPLLYCHALPKSVKSGGIDSLCKRSESETRDIQKNV